MHAGYEKTWNQSDSEQQTYSHSQDSLENSNVSQNVDTVLRGVAEGSYRSNTEEGKRILWIVFPLHSIVLIKNNNKPLHNFKKRKLIEKCLAFQRKKA